MAHVTRILADHGIPEPQLQKDGTYKVSIDDRKFIASISTGRHPVAGRHSCAARIDLVMATLLA
jgi:hypothetical protein